MVLAIVFGLTIIIAFSYRYIEDIKILKITPNLINFLMLGLGIILHGSIKRFTNAVGKSISDISGILIQFPLYFGIMGIMSGTGLVSIISDWFTEIASPDTLGIYAFLSAGLVNMFVPSGGGQWAVQGPVFIEAAQNLGVEPWVMVLAVAYGDQWTNMIQPFATIPLLAIAGLHMRQIMGYTFVVFIATFFVFAGGLFFIGSGA